jgi:hypothetical protein
MHSFSLKEIQMTQYASNSERNATPKFATLPAPAVLRQTFAPELPTSYRDVSGVQLEGKPDFLCQQLKSFTFLEYKAGKLNAHRTQESSRRALQYAYTPYDVNARQETHSFLSAHFWRTRPAKCLAHAFNHSLWKVLALQAEHGWQKYCVVFKSNPSECDANRYLAAGLVFCTEKTVADLLRTIELCQYGFFIPFQFKCRAYSFTVTPDHRDIGKPPALIYASDQQKLSAALAAADLADAEAYARAQNQDSF